MNSAERDRIEDEGTDTGEPLAEPTFRWQDEDETFPKECTMCGAIITREQWGEMHYNGPLDDGVDVLEIRTHSCGTSLAVVVGKSQGLDLGAAVAAEVTKSEPPPTQPSGPPVDRLLLTLDLAFTDAEVTAEGHKRAVVAALEAFRLAGYRPRVYRVQAAPARDPAVQHGAAT